MCNRTKLITFINWHIYNTFLPCQLTVSVTVKVLVILTLLYFYKLTLQSHTCCSLQEVRATPVKYMSDLMLEDSWSHLFMDTLAPNGFVKVQHWTGGMSTQFSLFMMFCCYSQLKMNQENNRRFHAAPHQRKTEQRPLCISPGDL